MVKLILHGVRTCVGVDVLVEVAEGNAVSAVIGVARLKGKPRSDNRVEVCVMGSGRWGCKIWIRD